MISRLWAWCLKAVGYVQQQLRRLITLLTSGEIDMPLNLEQLQAASDRLGAEVGETGDKVRADAEKIKALEDEVASIPGAQAKLDAIATSLTASADALDALQATAQAPNPGEPPPNGGTGGGTTDPNNPGFRGRRG